jgi:hypothetical protein
MSVSEVSANRAATDHKETDTALGSFTGLLVYRVKAQTVRTGLTRVLSGLESAPFLGGPCPFASWTLSARNSWHRMMEITIFVIR